ncbi:MAG: acyl-ACP--UDP-N-acetylglucosamine O-acyltransferase [Fibrobacterota bacterium]
MDTFLHPTAIVDASAQIGQGVQVGPYAILGPNVCVGDNTQIGPHVLIECNTVVGAGSVIHKGAALGVDPLDLKYGGEETWLEIGDRAVLREYCTLSRGSADRTVIGDDAVLMCYSHVAHDCKIGSHVILSNAANLLGHAEVGDHAIIGGLTFVNRHCRIGELAFVGGGFRVARDVPPYVIAGDEPLQITSVNTVALQKRGYSETAIAHIAEAYRLIHAGKSDLSAAIKKIRANLELTDELRNILSFIEKSEKGII